MSELLKGKAAIITGGSMGIGAAAAELLAQHGASVVITARGKDRLHEVAEKIVKDGGTALAVPGDVTSPEDCKNVFAQAIKTYGQVDIVVNNAGMSNMYFINNTTDEEWDKVIALNQTSLFYYCREAVLHMKPRMKGSIINVSSVNALRPIAGFAYSVSKYAVVGITRSIAYQFAGTNLRCNCLCPGVVNTPMTADFNAGKNLDEELMAILPKRLDMTIPFTDPIDQANVILFLASDLSSGMNGAIISADKGSYI